MYVLLSKLEYYILCQHLLSIQQNFQFLLMKSAKFELHREAKNATANSLTTLNTSFMIKVSFAKQKHHTQDCFYARSYTTAQSLLTSNYSGPLKLVVHINIACSSAHESSTKASTKLTSLSFVDNAILAAIQMLLQPMHTPHWLHVATSVEHPCHLQ